MSQSGVAERVGQWQYRAWKMPVAVVAGGQRVYFIPLFIHLFIYLIEPDGVRDVKKKRYSRYRYSKWYEASTKRSPLIPA